MAETIKVLVSEEEVNERIKTLSVGCRGLVMDCRLAKLHG